MTYAIVSNELYHHGIKNQKWGVRRFQNPDGTLTEAGKRRYGTKKNFEAGRTLKQAKEYERKKGEAIASGKTSEIQKYSKDMTPAQMAKAFQRINDEQKLADLAQKESAINKAKVANVIDTAQKVKTASETFVGLYNVVAKTYNSLGKSDEKLPIIGDNSNKEFDQINLEIKKATLKSMQMKNERDAANWLAEQQKASANAEMNVINRVQYEKATYGDKFSNTNSSSSASEKKKKKK